MASIATRVPFKWNWLTSERQRMPTRASIQYHLWALSIDKGQSDVKYNGEVLRNGIKGPLNAIRVPLNRGDCHYSVIK